MRDKKIYIFVLVLIISVNFLSAQSKKDIRNNKIESETATITYTENGKDITFKDSYTVYDKNGNVIEQTEYNRDGNIKSKTINKYDSNKNKIESIEYNDKTKTSIKTAYIYNKNDQKVMEIEYDTNGKITRQSAYLYNNKGFKTEKRTVDENKKLVAIKKYIYTAR